MAEPRVNAAAALVERHRLARLVAESRHRHRTQLPASNRGVNAGKIQLTAEQLAQWRAVQQRHRHITAQPQQAVTDEAPGLTQHARPVTAVHLMGMKALPDRRQTADRLAEMQRPAGQAHGIDGPGRGADDHRKRILRGVREQIGNRCQHPDLIGRTRPTARENQSGHVLVGAGGLVHANFPAFRGKWRSASQRRFLYSLASPGGRVLNRRWAHKYCSGQT